MYGKVGSNVSFPIFILDLPDKTLSLHWTIDNEECACPASSSIRQCGCNVNTHSLPRASYSNNTIYFTNLTVQANNTKVYFVYLTATPMDLREIAKSYQIIILGKFCPIQQFIILAIFISRSS